jgi:phosphoribosylglycinamide formyltransferase-1
MPTLNLAVLISGGGTTFQYIQDRIEDNTLDAKIQVVLSSNPSAFGLERAKKHNIPSHAFHRREYTEKFGAHAMERFNDDILAAMEQYPIDLVVCAGFMSFLSNRFIQTWRNRIINTHPALIPSFCGQDHYGHHVHEAAIAYGVKISGCTIHFVDEEYDHGAIIMQQCVPVHHDDTADTLAARVQAAEKPLYVQAIQLIAQGRVSISGRTVIITGQERPL